MKKIALYISIASALVVSNGMGMEDDCNFERQNITSLAYTNKCLEMELAAKEQELVMIKQAVNTVLSLSSYQQQLLSRKTQGEISDEAWLILGRTDPSLSDLVLGIKANSGYVDVVYTDVDSIKLKVDGTVFSRIYKVPLI